MEIRVQGPVGAPAAADFTGTELERDAGRHPGPPLLLLAIVHVALFIAAVLALTAFSSGGPPSPFGDAESAQRFFELNDAEARAAAFCHLASAIPLGLFAATVASRLRFFGVRSAGESIAFLGGIGAALMLMVSAACMWALSATAASGEQGPVRALQWLGFASGGPAMVALLGLLLAGVSVSAGARGLLPRWLTRLGLVTVAIAELSTLSLVIADMSYLLPIARILASVWLIAVGATMPASLVRQPGYVPSPLGGAPAQQAA